MLVQKYLSMETVSSRIYSFSLIGQVVKHFTGVRVSTDNQISLLQEDPSVLAQAGRILLADAPKLLPSTQPQSHPTGAERAASPPKRPGEGGRPIQVLLEQQAKQQASIKSPNSSVASLSKHLDPSLPRSTPTLSSEFSPIRSPNSSLVGSPQSRSRGVSPQRGSETNLYHSSPVPSNRSGQSSPLTKGRSYSDASSSHDLGLKQRSPNQGHSRQANRTFEGRNETAKERSASDVSSRSTVSGSSQYSSLSGVSRLTSSTDVQTAVLNTGKTVDPAMLASQRKPSPQKSLAEEIQESLAAPGGAVDSGQMSGASDTYLTRDLLQTFNQGLAQNRAKPLTVRTVDQGRVGNALDSPSSVSDKRTSDSGMLSREGTMGTMTPQSSTSELSVKSQREWTSANGKAGSHDEDLTFSADEFGRKLEAALKATPLNTTFNLHDESSYDHTQDKQKSSSLTNIRVKSLPNGDSGFSSSTALCKNGPSSSSDGNLYLNPDSGYPFQNGPKLGNFANISGVLNSSLLSEGVIFRAEDLQDPELTKLPDFSLSSPTPGSPSNPRMQSTPVPTRMPSPMSLLSFMTSMEQGGGDELLSLLEMIGQQSEKLRTELEEAQVREAQLLDEIEELQAQQVSHPQEEAVDSRVLAKLSQEVEVLRMENRKLYREAANAHSEVSLQKHAAEELHATITRLQQELDHTSAENFHLLNRLKGGESNPEAVLYARTLPSKGLTYRRNQHPQDKGVQSSLSGSVRRSDQIIHAVVEQQASTNPHMSDLGVQVDVVEAKSLMDAEKLRKENLELKKTLAGLRYEREDLQDRLNSKNQDMASRLKELNLELQERREEISTAVSDNKNLLKERDEARTKVEEAEDRLKDAEACNEAASKNYEELEEKLRAKQKEVDSMTQELAELKLDGRKLRDKLETAELETCSLREQLNKSQNFSRQPGLSPTSSLALQRENVHLRQKLETAYEEIQVLKDALQLEDSTAGSVKSVDSVSSSASSMNAEKENLKLRHKLGLASNEIDSLREQLQFEQSLGTVPSTLSQGKLKEQENRKLKDKISSLTYELETLRDKLHRAEEPPSSSLEKDNAELRQELSAAKSEIQSLHATVERYKLNREEVQDSIKELETALEDAHKEQLVLQKEMMALKEQYSKVKKELKVTKKQNKDGRTYDSDSQSDVSVRSVPSSSSEYLPLPGDKDASSPYSKLYHKLRQTIEKTGPPASKGGVGLPSPFKVSQKEQDISVGGSRDGDRTSGGDADVKSRVIFTDSKTATTNADTTSSRDPFKTSDHYNEYSRDERRDNYSYSYLSRDGKVWDYDDQSEHSLKMSMLESQQTKLSKEAGDKVSTNDLDLMSSHSQEGNDDLQKTLEKYSRSWMSQGHYDSPSYSRIWDDQGDIAKNLDLEFKGSEGGEGGTGHRGRTDAVKNGDIEVETNSKASGADQWSYNDNVRSQKTEWNSGLPDVSDSLSDADMTAGYNADKMATIQWDGDYRTETVSLTDKKEAHVSSGVEETTDIPNGHLDDEVYCSQQDREDPKLKDKLPCVPVKVPEVLPDPSAPPQLTPEQRDYANSLIEKYLKMSPVRYSLQTTSSNPDSRTASGEEAAEK
ncbi:SPTBN1 [Branchiostoma lanceolatum]|uniref:SPTBN1 protein n=1 Tax=Branchiostoma lanceolatum TaxID=7740 RepID=A0A8J9Z4N4_BRALA|nr:SPTBN1 [Branchiostoma lanceolatum]